MRSHAKASTAGSTQRQAKGLGRIFRGTLATRGSVLGAKGSGASKGRRIVLPAGALTIFLASLVFAAAAGAVKTHPFKETFGSAAQPTFTLPRSIAIDQASGDVIVMDAGSPPSIRRYNSDGTPDNFSALGTNVIDGQGGADTTPQGGLTFTPADESQIAIDNSGGPTDGDIYVTQSAPDLINIFSSAGAYLGQLSAAGATPFDEACGVAVDPAGTVYVGDYNGGIHKFVPAANPVVDADHTATFTTTTQPCTLAVGVGPTAGFLFPAQFAGPISKIDSATGALEYTVSSDGNVTVSVDPGTGHVYGVTSASITEFDAFGAGSATTVSSFASGDVPQGLAVSGASGEVLVSDNGSSNVKVFGALATVPGVTTGSASAIEPTSATLNGTVNPDGVEPSECRFEYGKTTSYGSSVSCAQSTATIGSGTSDVPVSADVSGLDLGAEYHFRLVAANPNDTINGGDSAFKLKSPPVLGGQWTEKVAFTEATLKGKVNPEGFATTYHIEYGPTTAYGQSTAEANVGSGKADHVVGIFLEELSLDTTYHYRIVATNSIGIAEGADRVFKTYAHEAPDTDCPNQAFRYGASANLPDCRAYEMVSPVEKSNGDIAVKPSLPGFYSGFSQAAVDGNGLSYSSYKAFGDARSGPYTSQYVATRGPEGWASHGINPPRGNNTNEYPNIVADSEFKAFSSDLSKAWLLYNSDPLTPDAPAGYVNLYMRDNVSESYRPLVATTPPESGAGLSFLPALQGATDDGSHVVFSVDQALTPNAAPGTPQQVYEWANGELRLVSILPGGAANTGNSSAGFASFGPRDETRYSQVDRAISEDGSRIFWTAEEPFGVGGQIYVRIDGATTVPVSGVVSNAAARYQAASTDGAWVVFTHGYFSGQPGAPFLYKVEVDTETPTLIAGEVEGVAGASEDVAYVYFVSEEALDGGAVAGEPNLYLDHEGAVSFIATLSLKDIGETVEGSGPVDPSVVAERPIERTSRVSPDGRHIAFMSNRSLTGHDNIETESGEPASEVFLYDAGSDELVCASCSPSGARPEAARPMTVGFNENTDTTVASWIPTWQMQLYGQRALADDGSRLFFNSHDALVPRDTNGRQDVYQWEEQGAGGCEEEDGCISLLSTGESAQDSAFMDADPSGDNVFFTTASNIDPRDPGLIDAYDTRVNGTPALPPPPPSPCVGDSCQSVPAAPNDPTPASAGFRGAGDPVARRDCGSQARRATELSRRAKRARRGATHASSPEQARRLRRRSGQLAKRAEQLSDSTARCRRANRRAAR